MGNPFAFGRASRERGGLRFAVDRAGPAGRARGPLRRAGDPLHPHAWRTELQWAEFGAIAFAFLGFAFFAVVADKFPADPPCFLLFLPPILAIALAGRLPRPWTRAIAFVAAWFPVAGVLAFGIQHGFTTPPCGLRAPLGLLP